MDQEAFVAYAETLRSSLASLIKEEKSEEKWAVVSDFTIYKDIRAATHSAERGKWLAVQCKPGKNLPDPLEFAFGVLGVLEEQVPAKLGEDVVFCEEEQEKFKLMFHFDIPRVHFDTRTMLWDLHMEYEVVPIISKGLSTVEKEALCGREWRSVCVGYESDG